MNTEGTIGCLWRDVAKRLRAAGIASAELDARVLAGHVLGLDTTGMIAGERELVDQGVPKQLDLLVARRIAGEPVARILGRQEFYGLAFALSAATLVPRPETELLVDLALSRLRGLSGPAVLDLGTGSGCIPIAILHELENVHAIAVDLSKTAIATAGANAVTHGVADRLELLCGSWFEPVPESSRFDLIASNPPYIEGSVIAGLDAEVREHDPRLALDGGADGLDAYRQILAAAPRYLTDDGMLILEIGFDQAAAVTLMCRKAGLYEVTTHADLAGHDRVIVARR